MQPVFHGEDTYHLIGINPGQVCRAKWGLPSVPFVTFQGCGPSLQWVVVVAASIDDFFFSFPFLLSRLSTVYLRIIQNNHQNLATPANRRN